MKWISVSILGIFTLGIVGIVNAMPVQFAENGHYYEYVPDVASWSAANDAANASSYLGIKGHLATISNIEENEFVSLLASANVWIGLTDEVVEGNFQWVTGEALSFTKWSPGNPNSINDPIGFADSDYVVLDCNSLIYGPGTWNDVSSDYYHYSYVIEYDYNVASVPEPATILLLGLSLMGLAGARRKISN